MPSIRLLQETIGALTKTSTTVVSLAPSKVTVGGQQYATTTLNCNISLLGLGGLDASIQAWKLYYVYVVASGGTPYLIASTSSTGPAGHSAYKLVGYFDTNNTPNINGAASTLQGSVGDIKAAHMTEAQFVATNGPGWILADGRNVTGSAWATLASLTAAPDARGVVLRGKNNSRADGNQDPGGERSLGSFQGQATAKNGLTASASSSSVTGTVGGSDGGHTHMFSSPLRIAGVQSGPSGSGVDYDSGDNGTLSQTNGTGSGHGHAHSLTAGAQAITIGAGDAETRMRNVAVNYFIRIN